MQESRLGAIPICSSFEVEGLSWQSRVGVGEVTGSSISGRGYGILGSLSEPPPLPTTKIAPFLGTPSLLLLVLSNVVL